MKKLVLLTLIIIPTFLLAQQKDYRLFALRPNGFRALPDTSKNYIVVDVPNTHKHDLYRRALKEVNRIYNNPKFVTAAIDGESIIIHGRQPDVFRGLMNSSYLVEYSFEIAFKDNKFKIESEGLHIENLKGDVLYLVDPGGMFKRFIFRQDGELKLDNAKYDLDLFFNNIVHQIVDATQENIKNDW